MLCCGYTLTDFPISIRLTSLALWQSNDCPSASKATLMNMDKYFMWIHYERLHNHNKAKHNKTVCIFLGIYCMWLPQSQWLNADEYGQNYSALYYNETRQYANHAHGTVHQIYHTLQNNGSIHMYSQLSNLRSIQSNLMFQNINFIV